MLSLLPKLPAFQESSFASFFDDFQNVSENYLNNRDFDNPSRAISNSTKSILSYDSPA